MMWTLFCFVVIGVGPTMEKNNNNGQGRVLKRVGKVHGYNVGVVSSLTSQELGVFLFNPPKIVSF